MVVFFLVILVITVSIHEFAHAWAADKLGDPTPSLAGRLTLNPAAHLDPIGSIMFLLIGFGWGKPVPFDPYNLRDPKRDAAIISLAGPASNLALAAAAALILRFGVDGGIIAGILETTIHLNVVLAVFNLLPVAPLDGFKIVGGLLSDEQAREWYSLERYGIIFLIFLLVPFTGGRSMLEIFVVPIIQNITNILIP
ncbi:hypothetical protein A2690_04500 [Candidatus Roizmanbacteria bacterium RIFCSPHIGHO2_01_FULL_39_12b]|uniref:Peptidase M50 domain-containing protein n=1 Tax=Candidatus Roizmanbacteria bacterium RIFCSPHIGHO2_01_FULL_39_12b TaxID=1802030 RepID=A0A1F7GBC1_9BACT|nr:MAG: hypothetical protein A2690_04500 [Candidatus Roizmanbacteria bacterium RIFCSPHIGHO2_01_FULL_39_12b]